MVCSRDSLTVPRFSGVVVFDRRRAQAPDATTSVHNQANPTFELHLHHISTTRSNKHFLEIARGFSIDGSYAVSIAQKGRLEEQTFRLTTEAKSGCSPNMYIDTHTDTIAQTSKEHEAEEVVFGNQTRVAVLGLRGRLPISS